jgi:hypothetical protein
MLQAKTELMLALLEVAEQTKTTGSLLRVLQHLDNFYGRDKTTVVIHPDLVPSGNFWCWYAYRGEPPKGDGEPKEPFYHGGLLCRDGEWSSVS